MSNEPHYTDDSFWEKLSGWALRAGLEVVEKALILYNALHDEETPRWARNMIIGALAYFILPIDAIPDAIPVAGFADDLGALAAAIATVSMYIKKSHIERARATLNKWFDRGSQTPKPTS